MKSLKENITGYLFLLPSLVAFALFILFPVIFSFVLSFCEWNLFSGFKNIKFVGFDNYLNLIEDQWFIKSLLNNIKYTVVVVTVTMIISLFLAIIFNKMVYMKNILRTIFFMPYISNIAAISIVWMALYHPSLGPLTQTLIALGIESPPKWLASPDSALWSIMVMTIWVGMGYNTIIYMAGLQTVPEELHEAAKIDGAGTFKRFIYVTLPCLSNITFFLVVTTIINSFQVFGPINIMTQGGPGRSTSVLVFYIYQLAFQFQKVGYASAVAWVLFLIIFIITAIQFKKREQ